MRNCYEYLIVSPQAKQTVYHIIASIYNAKDIAEEFLGLDCPLDAPDEDVWPVFYLEIKFGGLMPHSNSKSLFIGSFNRNTHTVSQAQLVLYQEDKPE